MAHITKRGELQWRARVRRKGYPALSKTFVTKGDAQAWVDEVESEMRRGHYVSRAEAEAMTLYEALGRYETEISAGKKGAIREKSIIKLLKATDQAKKTLAAFRSTDAAAIRDMWAKRLKPATVLRRLMLLSNLFTVARKEWGMESLANPIELIRKPKPNNERTRRVEALDDEDESDRRASDDELGWVMRATHSSELPDWVWVAVESAMRRGEIGSLQWKFIDLKKHVAHLPDTKNNSARDVPLSAKVVSILTARRKAAIVKAKQAAKKRRGRKPKGWTAEVDIGDQRVFGITLDAATRAFHRALVRARKQYVAQCQENKQHPESVFLVDLRLHDMRHEATSRLAEIYQIHELAKITGHKDLRSLMRYYHPKAENLAKRLN